MNSFEKITQLLNVHGSDNTINQVNQKWFFHSVYSNSKIASNLLKAHLTLIPVEWNTF